MTDLMWVNLYVTFGAEEDTRVTEELEGTAGPLCKCVTCCFTNYYFKPTLKNLQHCFS